MSANIKIYNYLVFLHVITIFSCSSIENVKAQEVSGSYLINEAIFECDITSFSSKELESQKGKKLLTIADGYFIYDGDSLRIKRVDSVILNKDSFLLSERLADKKGVLNTLKTIRCSRYYFDETADLVYMDVLFINDKLVIEYGGYYFTLVKNN